MQMGTEPQRKQKEVKLQWASLWCSDSQRLHQAVLVLSQHDCEQLWWCGEDKEGYLGYLFCTAWQQIRNCGTTDAQTALILSVCSRWCMPTDLSRQHTRNMPVLSSLLGWFASFPTTCMPKTIPVFSECSHMTLKCTQDFEDSSD